MPDWMSHLLIGLIVAELFNLRKKSLVLLGTLMPDLISKFYLLFFYLGFWNNIGLDSFHTPIMSFLLIILITPLFRYNKLKVIFLITLGVITHLTSDLVMKHFTIGVTTGTMLFFPFSMRFYGFGLIWPEQSVYVLVISLIIYILIKLVKKVDFDKLKI